MSIHGTYSQVSMADMIFEAKVELNVENTSKWDSIMKVWGEEGTRHLNCQSLVVKKQECNL